MTNREDMLAFIRNAYAACDGGNVESVVTAFHPDGVFTLMGDKNELELAGSMQRRASLRGAFSKFIEDFRFEGREFLAELIDGDVTSATTTTLINISA